MNTSVNNFDALEKLIFEEGLRIQAIDIHKEMDLLLIILNTKAILRQKISSYLKLQNATKTQLNNYELIAKGTGVHWPDLDEDLSLKGFLRDEIKRTLYSDSYSENRTVA
jgi:hypothetical protein